jgi:hypothetical protein
MRYSAVLQALALRMKDLEQQGDPVEIDRDTRVVVAAARGIVTALFNRMRYTFKGKLRSNR